VTRQRLATIFGWIAGGCLGLILNYPVFLVVGAGTVLMVSTFVLFIAGTFAGMWASDHLGPRGFRILGIAAGVMLAIAVALVVAMTLSTPVS
jgi:hypothetical protein